MSDPRLRGRYVVRISPKDVGRRVSVRSHITDGTGAAGSGPANDAPTTTDTLGELESWHDGVLAIRRRDGSLVELLESAVLAGKVVPPPPPPRPPRR